MSDKTIYKIITKREDGDELFQVLETNKIEFSLIHNAFEVDTTFSASPYQSEIQILLNQKDFERVDQLMADLAKSQLDLEDKNYYLYHFSSAELIDVIRKKDEWSAYDFQLSKVILMERGEDVSEGRLAALGEERIEMLSQGEDGPELQLVLGYLFALMGGIIGLMIGWYLWKSKKTLPNGEVVKAYNARQQEHGRVIFIIGLLVWILSFVIVVGILFQ